MVVLYDDYGFRQSVGGVSRYFAELVKHLPDSIESRLGIIRTRNLYLQDLPFSLPAQRVPRDLNWFCKKFLGGRYFRGLARIYKLLMNCFPNLLRNDDRFNELEFMRLARCDDVDVIHLTSAHQFDYNWQKAVGGRPFVVTVHDLIPELIQGRAYVVQNRKKVLEAAAQVIAVSEFTKSKIIELYGIPQEKITVIHHGFSMVLDDASNEAAPLVDGDYVLYVGDRHAYKNFSFFVTAMRRVMLKYPELRIVCTGDPFSYEEETMFKVLGVVDRFMHFFASDRELAILYKFARCFVYPSKMEGFGLPILEAFSMGCPVLLSNCSCFPEIAKKAALYFNDEDTDCFVRQMKRILSDEALCATLRSEGRTRLHDFSWRKCALETAAVYERAKKMDTRKLSEG